MSSITVAAPIKQAEQQAGASRPRGPWPETVLVAGFAVVVALLTRTIAPASLYRDGRRLPVDMTMDHPTHGGHGGHGGSGELVSSTPPSSVSDAPLPHLLGIAFLAAHLLGIGLLLGLPVLRRLLSAAGLRLTGWAGQLGIAAWFGVLTWLVVIVSARLGYGDRVEPEVAVELGGRAAQYAFAAAFVAVLAFGTPWRPSAGTVANEQERG